MTIEYTDKTATNATVKISGEDKITLSGYDKSFESDGSTSRTEKLSGEASKIEELYETLKAAANVSGADLSVEKAVGKLTVRYQSDKGEDPEPVDRTVPEWSFDIIEVQRPLASHPYFQVTYIPGAGVEINEGLAKVDIMVTKGEAYTVPAGFDDYDDWLHRYYSLRCAGIETYPALGLQLNKTYVTSDPSVCSDAFSRIGQVHTLQQISPPELFLAAMMGLDQIASYTSSDPNTVRYTVGAWEFVKRPPQMQSSGNENSNTVRITEMWWGTDRWAKVLYKGGTFDPPISGV